jgi:peptide/nickel transport system permease protein
MESTTPEVKLETSAEALAALKPEEKIFVASQWQLMWWRFRKHKMAIFGGIVMMLFYAVALFWEFLAPYDPLRYDVKYSFVPPQTIHFWDAQGVRSPFVYGLKPSRDPETLAMVFTLDPEKKIPLKFLVRGDKYKFWGLFQADLHLYGLESNDQVVFVLGSDRLGRDMVSRIFCGTRISTTIGLVGVLMSLILGILIGGISGFYGGALDTIIQRVIEFLRSVPTIPLWMGLSAAVPSNWPPVRVYFAITVILSLIGWTGMARVVRGKFLAMREEDFVMAAKLVGSSELRIIVRHMVPSFLSHIIASVTMAIPGMILAETSLSFLGLGMRPPAISWGVLLQEAQNLQAVALAPWLLLPGVFVIVSVLAFNFLGDGVRDAADPYAR